MLLLNIATIYYCYDLLLLLFTIATIHYCYYLLLLLLTIATIYYCYYLLLLLLTIATIYYCYYLLIMKIFRFLENVQIFWNLVTLYTWGTDYMWHLRHWLHCWQFRTTLLRITLWLWIACDRDSILDSWDVWEIRTASWGKRMEVVDLKSTKWPMVSKKIGH